MTEAVVVRGGNVWHVLVTGAEKTLCGLATHDDLYDPTILERQCRRCAQAAARSPVVIAGLEEPVATDAKGVAE